MLDDVQREIIYVVQYLRELYILCYYGYSGITAATTDVIIILQNVIFLRPIIYLYIYGIIRVYVN